MAAHLPKRAPEPATVPRAGRYTSFRDFYPFYLGQHANRTCRRLHVAGCLLVLAIVVLALASRNLRLLLLAPLAGYGFAWVGHFFYEHNRPATFQYPLYSFAGDWVMFWQILTRKIAF
ncbi:DUF962 domain-containing protein [Massilia sp. PAMC28688]|uniref:DUF962 domain-containing protein n=1 Tax=Massilia sp. PAMC28688 TaxID=2861283 RepID=UPI001C627CE7|nr:DUF962 domain-containing protein [Massilia sp. PAMC28688]QYF93440.1 DUF962 domain-containing protein [Massilia sp. PAMC28688]